MKKLSLVLSTTLLFLAGAALANPDQTKKRVVVDVTDGDGEVRVIELEGMHGDGHEMIFVGEDGNVTKLDDGTTNHWVSKMGNDFVFHPAMGPRPILGVQLVELTPELRAHYGVESDTGVLVSKVVEDSAAERAGIEVGDILTAINGEKVSSTFGIRHSLSELEEGDVALVDLSRNGRLMTVNADVELGELPFHGLRLHQVEVNCDGEGDCDHPHAIAFENECEGLEQCEVRVMCGDEGCNCTVNDEEVACPDSMPHHP